MSAMLALESYNSGDSSPSDNEEIEQNVHGISRTDAGKALMLATKVNAAPAVISKESMNLVQHVDPCSKQIFYNPKFEQLYAPEVGPGNPNLTEQQKAMKNTLTGFVEEACVSDFQFEIQRRTFHTFGYAHDPSAATSVGVVGDAEKADETGGLTVFESKTKKGKKKRSRVKPGDPGDVDGYLGPWAGYVDEERVSKPGEEDRAYLEEYIAKKQKREPKLEPRDVEELTELHIEDSVDYQGRSFLHPPMDIGVNLRAGHAPHKCFIPKRCVHTWTGHSKGVQTIRWFPGSAHMILSASLDCKVKLWEVYHGRRCVRTYSGHSRAVRDVCFNRDGSDFLSAGYDRMIKLWDTETGQCKARFNSHKVPYVVKFHPDENKQHLFLAGNSDKKILCWDTRSQHVVQEYDRHLGAVNTITFVDNGRRFVSTSDDKSVRVWEWDIPVDFKYIADPTMHSMPAASLSPNERYIACQSMDNKIQLIEPFNNFRMKRKKVFKGHMVSGYACGVDFSPDMSYLISGDADGRCFFWDFRTGKVMSKMKAHEGVCIGVLWHPHETSKVATCGWDGLIKLWD